MAKPSGSAAKFGARLKQIADTLGISVSQLYGERDPLPVGDALELYVFTQPLTISRDASA